MQRLASGPWLVLLTMVACGCSRPWVDDTAERVEVPAPALDRSAAMWELGLRLAEWGLDESALWHLTDDGAIALCWHPQYLPESCHEDPTRFDHFATLDEALATIDGIGALGGTQRTFEDLVWAGGGWRQVGAPLRGIEKLFWALALADLHNSWFTADEYPSRLAPDAEIEAALRRLAERYGLHWQGPFVLDERLPEEEREDISFGTFLDETGVEWICTRDVSASVYCCDVSCWSENESMSEPH